MATGKTSANSDSVFQLIDSTEPPSGPGSDMIATGTISLFGVQKHLSIQILDHLAGLSDLIPLAWALSDVIMSETINHARTLGKRTSCQQKCSACCGYLVPLAIPEVIRLFDEIQALPAQRSREMWGNSLSVAGRLLNNDACEVPNGETTLENLGVWYSDKQVTCPFLENDLCTIYDQRPLACREYLVTTSPQCCRTDSEAVVEKLELPLSILECLGEVAADLEGTAVEGIMLPLILPWVLKNRERTQRRWSAQTMAQRFLDVLSA